MDSSAIRGGVRLAAVAVALLWTGCSVASGGGNAPAPAEPRHQTPEPPSAEHTTPTPTPTEPTAPAPEASAAALAMVEHARETLGTPYRLGGRCRRPGDGIDCQGVLFYAAERVGECSWRSYSVNPTETVADGELGEPVPGMDPVATADLRIEQLAAGDVLFLVDEAENTAEPAIGALGDTPVWVWHTGLYAGDGRWIVGDHYAGQAVETDLTRYLRDHAGAYQGVFVLRLADPPRPARCRTASRLSCPDG